MHGPLSAVRRTVLSLAVLTALVPTLRAADEADREIAALKAAGFDLVDHHAHLKGGLTLTQVLAHAASTGIRYGIAVNCGIGFAVTNDAGIDAWLAEMKDAPVLRAMQAEGREWVRMFSPQAVAKFDYVFTDAMTFTDGSGRRTRLWIKEEVDVPDPQAFMDLYVERITGILENEPIDLYVNATFLPEVIAADYDRLWTPERMDRVIAAAVRHGIAIEINARYRIPSAAFIRRAKAAGAKFSLGTNNTGPELGRLEYPLAMIRACGLAPDDLFKPKPDGRKPIQTRWPGCGSAGAQP